MNIAAAENDFWWYRGMRQILFGLLDPLIPKRRIHRVLEAGCGTGYNAAALHERYGWQTYPLDLQMQGLQYAQGLGNDRITQAVYVAALPFASGAFDAVFSLDVIVHFPRGQESTALAELSRVLAPGGLLVVRVAALDILRSRHSEFTCERQRFTARRLMAALATQGIRKLRCTYANTLLLPIALARFRIWEPLFQRTPRSGVEPVATWMNKLLSAPLGVESRCLSSGLNFPFGQSLIMIGEKHA